MRGTKALSIVGAGVLLASCGLADPPPLVAAGTPAWACDAFDAGMVIGYATGSKQIEKPIELRPGEYVVVTGRNWSEVTPAMQTSFAWNLDCEYSEEGRHLTALHFRATPDGPDLLTYDSAQLEALRPFAELAPGAAKPGG